MLNHTCPGPAPGHRAAGLTAGGLWPLVPALSPGLYLSRCPSHLAQASLISVDSTGLWKLFVTPSCLESEGTTIE